jgi:isopenicillin N synthase-like dioxygenase
LDALSLVLDLSSADSLSGNHAHSIFNFDLLHYPAVSTQLLNSGKLARVPAHSDFGTLTLLFQDDVGGLEIADLGSADTEKSAEFEKHGSFTPVKPVPGTVVVNIGYLLMRWSNGRWKNTIHRVMGPSSLPMQEGSTKPDNPRTTGSDAGSLEDTTPERYSIPFFASPDPEAMIDALPGCWSQDVPKRWKPVNSGDFLRRKRDAISA